MFLLKELYIRFSHQSLLGQVKDLQSFFFLLILFGHHFANFDCLPFLLLFAICNSSCYFSTLFCAFFVLFILIALVIFLFYNLYALKAALLLSIHIAKVISSFYAGANLFMRFPKKSAFKFKLLRCIKRQIPSRTSVLDTLKSVVSHFRTHKRRSDGLRFQVCHEY